MDSHQLNVAIARLARAATGDFALDTLLTEMCEAAADAMPVDSVGVMASDGTRTRFVHANAAALLPVERLQEALQQGPCRAAVESGSPVAVSDLTASYLQRSGWPEYSDAVDVGGLRAVLVVPLLSRGRVWGTLDLYRDEPHAWTEQELEVARLLADVAVSYLVMAADRDAARAAEQVVTQRLMYDELTGLANRGLLFDRIRHALMTSRRRDTALAVLFVDLDHFKTINDTFGHSVGDQVLIEVASRLAGTMRAGDTLARLAGDKFVLLCEDLPGHMPEQLTQIVKAVTGRVRDALAEPIRLQGVDVTVAASVGVAVTTDQPSAEDLLYDADTAMYRAKELGRGRVVVRDHVADAALGYGRQLERDLLHALDREQLRVHYQPIFAAGSSRVVAVEALLRWQHPQHGLLSAAGFLGLAETTGTLPGIGRWVIEQSCSQLAAWQATLGDRSPDLVFCNLSARELQDPGLDEVIAAAVAANHLQPAQLGLELVEDDFADPALLPLLADLQQRGHHLSVDDFGTGYSSLSRIVQLPIAIAKIDRSFIAGLPGDPRSRALVDAVRVIARGLDLELIGEGVETQAQADYLTAAGCQYLQGFHLARPLPADQLTSLLAAP